jgi:hypothetical protein
VPEAYDDSDAFFRRWLIIVFPNQFINEKADPYILQKLTTPEELSGLLNLVLPALKRLLEKGQFSYSKTTEEIREDYIRKSSPIAAFVMDCLEVDSDAFIIKQDLYNAFAAYCRERKIPCVTKDTFFKNLPQHIPVIDHRPKINGIRVVTFKGIRYSPNVSTLSNVSKAFYTLSQRKPEYDNGAWDIKELNGDLIQVSIRETQTPDRIDRPDTEIIAEKLEQLKTWLIENKDEDGLIDCSLLASKIKELNLPVQPTIKLLKDEYWLRDAPAIGKFGVK